MEYCLMCGVSKSLNMLTGHTIRYALTFRIAAIFTDRLLF